MTGLLRAELKRLLSRRILKALTVLALLGFLAAGVISFIVTGQDENRAAGVAIEETAFAQCVQSFEGSDLPEEEIERICAESMSFEDPRFLYTEMEEIIEGLAFPFIMLAWLLGSTSIGAEWAHRTITTLLTWEPRRVVVILAKMVAAALVTFAWLVALEALFSLSMLPSASAHGSMEGADAAWLADYALSCFRIAGVGVAASLFGFSLATIGRNTAAALGVGFVYLAIVESLVRGLKPAWTPWLVGDNLATIIVGEQAGSIGRSPTESAVVIGSYVLVMMLVAIGMFQRREIA